MKALRLGNDHGAVNPAVSKKTLGRIGHQLGKYVPDSGQEHTADGDDGFLVTTADLNPAITLFAFRVLIRYDDSICDLDQEWLEECASTRNPGRFTLATTLVVAGTTASPRGKVLRRRKHGHISADFRNDRDGGHRIGGKARNGMKQGKQLGVWRGKAQNFILDTFSMRLNFVDMLEAFAKLGGLLTGNSAIDGSLNLLDWIPQTLACWGILDVIIEIYPPPAGTSGGPGGSSPWRRVQGGGAPLAFLTIVNQLQNWPR